MELTDKLIELTEKVTEIIKEKKSGPEYHKKYYEAHKAKLISQVIQLKKKYARIQLVNGLNNNTYTRVPISKILKYNVIYNEKTNLYE